MRRRPCGRWVTSTAKGLLSCTSRNAPLVAVLLTIVPAGKIPAVVKVRGHGCVGSGGSRAQYDGGAGAIAGRDSQPAGIPVPVTVSPAKIAPPVAVAAGTLIVVLPAVTAAVMVAVAVVPTVIPAPMLVSELSTRMLDPRCQRTDWQAGQHGLPH